MNDQPQNIAPQLALWADQLRALSALGLHYAGNIYERTRCTAIQDIAMAMMALATDTPVADFEPLRDTVFAHLTPFAVGDGAVIDDMGRLLLIRRADNGLWAMPGGALEVGETPGKY